MKMVTSVPLSLQRDWDLLAQKPRDVMYTEAAERKRRHLWAGILIVLALTVLVTQRLWGTPATSSPLPVILVIIGVVLLVTIAIVLCVEVSLAEQHALLKEGIPHVATIIRHWKSDSQDYPIYQLTYCFVTESGGIFTGLLTVSQALYERWDLDTPIIVLASPTDPHRFTVYDLFSDVALKP
jgi:hypothetical protein